MSICQRNKKENNNKIEEKSTKNKQQIHIQHFIACDHETSTWLGLSPKPESGDSSDTKSFGRRRFLIMWWMGGLATTKHLPAYNVTIHFIQILILSPRNNTCDFPLKGCFPNTLVVPDHVMDGQTGNHQASTCPLIQNSTLISLLKVVRYRYR